MSRGPGKIERVVERALRDTDRSFSVEELTMLAYPGINRAEKKHRVAVLRTLDNISERLLVWLFRTYEARGRYFVCDGSRVRPWVHGLLRQSWWNAERSLQEIEGILNDPEIQSVMEPGGLWWTEIEINKAKYDKTLSASELADLAAYRDALATFIRPRLYANQPITEDHYLVGLLGKFEPPGSPGFEYAMELRAKECGLDSF